MKMKITLLVAGLVAAFALALSPPPPAAEGQILDEVFVFERGEVEDFVQFQFDNYFADCVNFVSTFHPGFTYCDAQPCVSERKKLLAICEQTEGTFNIINRLDVLPASYPDPDPFNPDYSNIAITGLQTVWLPLPQFPDPIPLCFNFSIREELKADHRSFYPDGEPIGFSSRLWEGFYKVTPGACISEIVE
jgi:hypothetical protein